MTFVVTEACIRCKYTDCVNVCPVDAFREGPNFLVIDPDECIDCAVCVPECPVKRRTTRRAVGKPLSVHRCRCSWHCRSVAIASQRTPAA